MNNRGSGKVWLAVAVVVIGLYFIVGSIVKNSKCIHYGCNNSKASGYDYCYTHLPKVNNNIKSSSSSGSSYSGNSTKSSGSSYGNSSSSKSSSGSNTSKNNNLSTKSSFSKNSSSKSKSTSKSRGYDSYDAGYDDVYDNDDYDWDRYYRDSDYADGVDDAMDELDW